MDESKKIFTSSFNTILMTEFVLMIGYVVFKLSLSIFLYHDGYSLDKAYSLATTSLSLYAIGNILWGQVNKYYEQRKGFLFLGILFIAISFVFILFRNHFLQLLGISLFTMGSSLYVSNISLLVNEQFDTIKQRQQGNQAMQWILNAGCILSVGALSFSPVIITFRHLYFIGGVLSFLALIFFHLQKKKIKEINSQKLFTNDYLILGSIFLLCFLTTVTLMNFEFVVRCFSILLFIGCLFYIGYLAYKEKNKNYISFLLILMLCIFIYWLSYTIFSNQFTVFLIHHVNGNVFGIKLSPLFAMIFDPLANVVCGAIIFILYRIISIRDSTMLIWSLFLNALAFGILAFAIKTQLINGKLSIFWPILCVFLYATSEFLIVATTSTQVSTLINDRKKQGFFFGVQRLCVAFSSTVAYYLISLSQTHALNVEQSSLASAGNVYICMMIISLISLVLFLFFRYLRLIGR